MQYYCIETENCGFYDKCKEPNKYPGLICPVCFSPLLKYPDGKKPSWLKNQTILAVPIKDINHDSEEN